MVVDTFKICSSGSSTHCASPINAKRKGNEVRPITSNIGRSRALPETINRTTTERKTIKAVEIQAKTELHCQ